MQRLLRRFRGHDLEMSHSQGEAAEEMNRSAVCTDNEVNDYRFDDVLFIVLCRGAALKIRCDPGPES